MTDVKIVPGIKSSKTLGKMGDMKTIGLKNFKTLGKMGDTKTLKLQSSKTLVESITETKTLKTNSNKLYEEDKSMALLNNLFDNFNLDKPEDSRDTDEDSSDTDEEYEINGPLDKLTNNEIVDLYKKIEGEPVGTQIKLPKFENNKIISTKRIK
mgnify:CR=1 FL=1